MVEVAAAEKVENVVDMLARRKATKRVVYLDVGRAGSLPCNASLVCDVKFPNAPRGAEVRKRAKRADQSDITNSLSVV